MNWPEKPICHGEQPHLSRVGVTWRDPQPQGRPEDEQNPYGYPFRTCSYCGSIHPEDLLKFLNEGAKLGGADWKYGWPHKFYVKGIPNPLAGKEVRCYASCGNPRAETLAEGGWEKGEDGVYRKLYSVHPASAHTHAKWYNDHLDDLNDEAFAHVVAALEKHAGIKFARDGGKLKYAAPHAGYQHSTI